MHPQKIESTLRTYLYILIIASLSLGIFHLLYADLKIGHVRWFNLDGERNLPTWFNGILFFLLACASFIAFLTEKMIQKKLARVLTTPELWLLLSFSGALLSLDEITILHENLFWRDVRRFSSELGPPWIYLTQWQILYAPFLGLGFIYFFLFFLHRFKISKSCRKWAFYGLASWALALLLEGVRGIFKHLGPKSYTFQVLIEEELEMLGAIFLLACIVKYTLDIALGPDTHLLRLSQQPRFFTRTFLKQLFAAGLGLTLISGTIFYFAKKQSDTFNRDPSNKKDLLNAAIEGGNYLIRATQSSGRFVYLYDPQSGKESTQYNLIRHAGTVYSLLDLYETTKDPKLFRKAKAALEYLLASSFKPLKINGSEVLSFVEKGHIKLGGNALTALALAKYIELTRDKRKLLILKKIGLYIETSQRDDGSFIHKKSYPRLKETGFTSEYYPGEAILALLRIYRLVPEAHWLESAKRGVDYLINIRDRNVPEHKLIHDHWLLYALNDLYRYIAHPLYIAHSLKICKIIMGTQHILPPQANWHGSFYDPPRVTPTATRMEGLCATYSLMRYSGHEKEARKILTSIQACARFLMQCQFQKGSASHFKNSDNALGGFPRSLSNFEIRIDYVQHSICGLLSLYRMLGDNPVFSSRSNFKMSSLDRDLA